MKLPAYGKSLIEARRAGTHPEEVMVVYGNDWAMPTLTTRLAVKPGDALGRDWRCVSGLPIEFVNLSSVSIMEIDDGEPLRLVAEIARYAAHVTIIEGGQRVLADVLARLRRGQRPARWPAWWSEEIEKTNGQNRKRWVQEAAQYLARFAA